MSTNTDILPTTGLLVPKKTWVSLLLGNAEIHNVAISGEAMSGDGGLTAAESNDGTTGQDMEQSNKTGAEQVREHR